MKDVINVASFVSFFRGCMVGGPGIVNNKLERKCGVS